MLLSNERSQVTWLCSPAVSGKYTIFIRTVLTQHNTPPLPNVSLFAHCFVGVAIGLILGCMCSLVFILACALIFTSCIKCYTGVYRHVCVNGTVETFIPMVPPAFERVYLFLLP